MHLLYRSNNFWNAPWKSSCVSVSMTFVTASFISWSNSLWQGWSWRLVHCPAGNAADPIWKVLASSLGISSWTPLKPQHSNPNTNPNPLANKLWCYNFLTLPTPLIIPHRLPIFLNLLYHSETDARFIQDAPKAVGIIPYVSVAFFPI